MSSCSSPHYKCRSCPEDCTLPPAKIHPQGPLCGKYRDSYVSLSLVLSKIKPPQDLNRCNWCIQSWKRNILPEEMKAVNAEVPGHLTTCSQNPTAALGEQDERCLAITQMGSSPPGKTYHHLHSSAFRFSASTICQKFISKMSLMVYCVLCILTNLQTFEVPCLPTVTDLWPL